MLMNKKALWIKCFRISSQRLFSKIHLYKVISSNTMITKVTIVQHKEDIKWLISVMLTIVDIIVSHRKEKPSKRSRRRKRKKH